jgi:Tfp pilus assembly protein FimT
MKKAIFLFSFLFAVGIAAASAQSCPGGHDNKSCCSAKASKAAATDPTIEKRKADDGTVAFVRKTTDAQGNAQFVSVQYDEASNAFVNVAPKTISAGDKAACTKKTAACCAGAKDGKACCAKAADTEVHQ